MDRYIELDAHVASCTLAIISQTGKRPETRHQTTIPGYCTVFLLSDNVAYGYSLRNNGSTAAQCSARALARRPAPFVRNCRVGRRQRGILDCAGSNGARPGRARRGECEHERPEADPSSLLALSVRR